MLALNYYSNAMFDLTQEKAEEFAKKLIGELNDNVFNNIYNYLRENPEDREYLNPAFPFPRKVRIGLLDGYLVVEHVGPNEDHEDDISTEFLYDPTKTMYDFLEMDFSHLKAFPRIPCNNSVENMVFFLGDSIDYLTDYFYDFTQIPEDFCLNGILDITQSDVPCVLNNCTFFWSDSAGALRIKHIDLLELFPYQDGNCVYHTEPSLIYFSNYIISNKVPTYRVELHNALNHFIHLISLQDTSEPEITKFLSDHPGILQISFGQNRLNPQVELFWQYDAERSSLKPDFLPEKMDGYCDIMEFKLPYIKSKPLVGNDHRTHPSYEIDKAIAQLDEYEEWFSQELNRTWLTEAHGIKVLNPVRYLIIGHSKEFSAEGRRRLRNTRNTVFFTYDEFIEMARYQIYRVR